MFDLDQYYTPPEIAENIISNGISITPEVCVDSTCGSGNLLAAAKNAFPNLTCVGLDKDRNVIANLKRKNPNWILSTADLLNPTSYKRSSVLSEYRSCDLLLLNPPFSQGNKKFLNIQYNGVSLKGSVAMAYILKSFELFKPTKGALIVVPESILYSNIDKTARELLQKNYGIKIITELENTTFRGATVRATVIKLDPFSNSNIEKLIQYPIYNQITSHLIRGGLPVHKRDHHRDISGIKYIHSTDIRSLHTIDSNADYCLVSACSKGVTSGWNILIPRVGVPNKSLLKPVFSRTQIRLSDCVIALQFNTKSNAVEAYERIQNLWEDFFNLYRGTGARYITMDRLELWLESINIINII